MDACVAAARARAQETGAGFVHPFDDPDIILGQSTLGLELLEDVPDLEQVVVPVGGGGLISGIAGVVKAAQPATARIVGVQVDACAPFPESLRGSAPITFSARATIADGIAIKRPGDITLPLVHRWVDDMVVVSEEDIADAMVWLLERSKLVVEGGGAAGVAAVLAGQGRAGPARRHRDRALGRQRRRRPARRRGPTQRDAQGPAHATLHAHLRPARRPGRLCSRSSPTRAGTSCTSTTSATRWRSTSARPESRSRWRRAARQHSDAIVAALESAGYEVHRHDG